MQLIIGIGLALIVGGIVIGRFLVVPAVGDVPENLGWRGDDEGFRNCPEYPGGVSNCVSSTASPDSNLYIEPISFTGTVDEAKAQLLAVIEAMPRHTILENNGNYLHVEFRSLTMGFPDDTEFYFDAENSVIHVRSAARLGRGDMGVNRNRVESIRSDFQG